jgi:ribonuclease HI
MSRRDRLEPGADNIIVADSDGDRPYFRLSADGGVVAERGQAAGEAAIGVVLTAPDGTLVHQISARIGWTHDHHEAEYRALIAGLRLARGHGIEGSACSSTRR